MTRRPGSGRESLPDRGAAMVEFAIISIPLLILVMGIIQFGFLFNAQISIQSAAREGARELALKRPNWESAVQGALNLSDPVTATAVSTCPTPSTSTTSYAKVQVSTTFSLNMPFLPESLRNVELDADAAMRCGL